MSDIEWKRDPETGLIRLVYLAQPYTHDDKGHMVMRHVHGSQCAAALTQKGYNVFAPIPSSHCMSQHAKKDLPTSWAFWKTVDLDWLHRVDEVWVLAISGWQASIGVKEEIEFMKGLNKPVYYCDVDANLMTEEEANAIY